MNAEEAKRLYRSLSEVVDQALKETKRDPADPPTDGSIAVMTIFGELEKRGYVVYKPAESPRNSRMK